MAEADGDDARLEAAYAALYGQDLEGETAACAKLELTDPVDHILDLMLGDAMVANLGGTGDLANGSGEVPEITEADGFNFSPCMADFRNGLSPGIGFMSGCCRQSQW